MKFDISGDTKDPIVTNKHAVKGGACNVFEIISLDIDVPVNADYSPVLTVYAYDNLMGIFGQRLVGIANIPLATFCEKVNAKLKISAGMFGGSGGKKKSSAFGTKFKSLKQNKK
jgi:hypothetical protein